MFISQSRIGPECSLLFFQPAGYIPQLARVPKDKWGISICTVDGQRFSIGDVHDKFTIQSTSKPITYSLTLEELGTDTVHKYQGREPSGRMFNEIVLDHNSEFECLLFMLSQIWISYG